MSDDFQHKQTRVPERAKFTVSLPEYPDIVSPNPLGWYYKSANIVLAKDGTLVASFPLSDSHHPVTSYLMVARSTDGGRTWSGHQVIAHSNVWTDRAVWVVPQMSVLRDGRLVIICDKGNRNPWDSFPMLSEWQKQPERGMANYLFWSSDHGKTWSAPQKVDDVGGEPSYIIEMSDGTLAYTRTSSATTTALKNPPLPWGTTYYLNTIVFSDNGGKSWDRTKVLADDPFHGDCEVGLVELRPGTLLAATRIGLGNGVFAHPSRLVISHDSGRTWEKPELAPFYGHRVHIGRLQSGRLLATFRQVWGTCGTYALVFDPEEKFSFQPSSWILDESRCALADGVMTVRSGEGTREAVGFSLYPAQDDESLVEIKAVLRVLEADVNGCNIGAGCWVRVEPRRISLADMPEIGFDLDATQWHEYHIRREEGRIRVSVDGQIACEAPIGSIWQRDVHFGNRKGCCRNVSHSQWRSISVVVHNHDSYSIEWDWKAADGYPDQFRRNRLVLLDRAPAADGGYTSWTQLPDQTIVIVDYTTEGNLEEDAGRKAPFIRAYRVTEKDLTNQV